MAFADSFLAAWTGARLGASEERRLLILHLGAGTAPGHRSGTNDDGPATTIAAHGGHVIRRSDGELLGAWGVREATPADHARIVAAAQALCRAAPLRPVIDLQTARVPKSANPDAAVLAASARLLEAAKALPAPPRTIVLSAAFRQTCTPDAAVRPIGPARGDAPAFYAARDDAPLPPGAVAPCARLAQIDDLGDLKPVTIAAAIAGRVFTLDVLAWMLEMAPARLQPAIEAGCTADLFRREPGSAGVERIVFRDDDLQAAAYAMVPPGDRLRLHRRNAERAVRHLQEALHREDPSPHPNGLDRALRQLLGVQMAMTHGNGSNAVLGACRESIAAARPCRHSISAQQMRSMWLAQSCHLVRGEVGVARTIGRRLLSQLTQPRQRSRFALGAPLLVHRMYALALMLSGRLQHAARHYERVIGDYDAARHGVLRFAWGSDQVALAHAHYAWTQALAGNAPAVPLAIRHARAACERYHHAHTTAHALSVAAIAALTAGAADEAAFAAREARAVAVEHRFPYWAAWNDIMLAAIDAESFPRAAYRRLDDVHRGYRETGAAQLSPVVCALRSAAALRCRRPGEGLEQADVGLALARPDGCSVYRPELLRHRARALFALGHRADADYALETAYCEAVRSGTKCFARRIVQDGLGHSSGRRYRVWQSRFQVAEN